MPFPITSRTISHLVATLALLIMLSAAVLAEPPHEFQDLFDGEPPDGWVPLNVAPGTFSVCGGMIVSSHLYASIDDRWNQMHS